jgi:mRNA interferase MazF
VGRLADTHRLGPWISAAVIIVQSEAFNRTEIATVVCVPLTTNLGWAEVPGNALLTAGVTRLPKDSVANASQIIAIDKELLLERAGRLSRAKIELVLAGVATILGL